ncbi:MAG: biotin/lipoyl-binding protein [Thiotrichaceae bacterium]
MRKIVLPIIILAVSIAVVMYLVKTRPEKKPIDTKERAWVVATQTVTPVDLSPSLSLYGRVESPRTSTLRSPTFSATGSGEVVELAVLEGQTVKAKQVLLRLDDRDSKLNLQQREADIADIQAQLDSESVQHQNDIASVGHEETLLRLVQKSVDRATELEKRKLGSVSAADETQQAIERQYLSLNTRRTQIKLYDAKIQQLQAKLQRAMALRDAAKLELERTQIHAPFAGTVAKVEVAIGDRVRGGDALLTLYDNSALEVRSQIPLRYQGVILDSLANKQFLTATTLIDEHAVRLRLTRIAGQINKDSGGIDGLFTVEQGAAWLRLGQLLNLTLNLPETIGIVALPFEAVYGTNRIYKLQDNRMQGVVVERVGEKIEAGQSRILVRSSELKQGDQVITTQLPNAMDGLKVQTLSR